MKQPLVEKLASTALSRRLNEPGRFMSVGGAAAGANVNTAFKGARNSATNALGAGHPEIMQRAVAAKGAAGGKIGASTAKNLVSGEGKDLLATTSIRQRLEGHRATLGLSAANGDRAKQIGNANALRAGKERGLIGGDLTATSGFGGHAPTKPVAPGLVANANSISKGLADSAAGHHVHMDIGNGHVGLSSARPMAAAKPGLLDRAKSLAGMAMGKFKGLSTAKKLAVGAGAGLAAIGAKKMMSSNNQQEKWASDMSNKYLEKMAKRDDYLVRAMLVSPHSQEKAIAKDHGKKVKTKSWSHADSAAARDVAINDSVLKSTGIGASAGMLAGMVGGTIAASRNPAKWSRLSPFSGAAAGAGVGTLLGSVGGDLYHSHQYNKQHAKEMHKKYANADTSEVQGIDYSAALGRMLSKG